jgi:hypothetical protein
VTDPVVIGAFRAPVEAEAARDAIRGAGMSAEVVPRSDVLPRFCDDAFEGGLDVIVDRADADAAIAILHRLWPDESRARAVPTCPACGSNDVARLPRLRLFLVVTVLLLVVGELTKQRELFALVIGIFAVLFLIAKPMRCRSCGERWRGKAPLADDPVEGPPAVCPRCGSDETEPIPRRRERAWTLLVNFVLPPLFLVWPFRPRRGCTACGYEWR